MGKKDAYFHVVYDGPALESNEMDIKDLAPALLAISEALEETNRVFNQGRAEISVNIKGSFKVGCFGIDLNVTQDILQNLLNIVKSDDIVAGATLLAYLGFGATAMEKTSKGLLQVLKWLKGRPIKNVKMSENNLANIYTEDDSLEVDKAILELLQNYKIRKALEKAIAEPLERHGIDTFASTGGLQDAKNDRFLVIDASEVQYFISPEPDDETIDERTYEANLQAISVVFQQDNKWRFSDGTATFFAEIKDHGFIEKVQNNDVAFSKDDILKVKLHVKTILTAKGMKTGYTVLKVLGHRQSARQLKLPMS